MNNTLSLPLFFIKFLLVVILVLPVEAEELTVTDIKIFNAQLIESQYIHNEFITKIQCYLDQDTHLQANSSKLQQIVGDLHQEEQGLSSKLVQAKFEAEKFQQNFEQARNERNRLKNKTNKIRYKIMGHKETLKDCKKHLWIFGFTCDLAAEISGLKGQLRKLSNDEKEVKIKVNSLNQQVSDAQGRLNKANKQLAKIQNTLHQAKNNITTTEAEIKLIKMSLAEIRRMKQNYTIEHNQFNDIFTELKNLDPLSERRSIIRRLRQESIDLSEQQRKARALFDENGLQLSNGKRICIN